MKKRIIIGMTVVMMVAGISALAYRMLFPPPRYQGRPVSVWVAELCSADYHVSHRAQTTIPDIGAPAVPYLVKLVRHREGHGGKMWERFLAKVPWLRVQLDDLPRGRMSAVQLLPSLGADPGITVPALVEALYDDDKNLAASAREALVQTGPTAVPELCTALNDGDAQTRYLVASTLTEFGPEARAAVPALIDATHDPVPEIRSLSIQALSRASDDVDVVLPALTGAMYDKVITVRLDAITAIGGYGERAKLAVPALQNALHDSEMWVRTAAAYALGRIGPASQEAAPVLQMLLKDPSNHVRISACSALWQIQHRAEPLLPVLHEALRDPSYRLRGYAAQTLIQIGPPAYPLIPAILDSIKTQISPDSYNTILRLLSDADAEAVPDLAVALGYADSRVRMGALLVLGKMAPRIPSAAAEIQKSVSDTDPAVRAVAERVLRQLQPHARQATPNSTGG